MDPTGTKGWTESQLEWFTSWTLKNPEDLEDDGTVKRGDPLDEGFSFEDFQAHDSNPLMFGMYPMPGGQLEAMGNSAPSRKQRRQGQGASSDGTDSMKMVSKALKMVRPVKCKDKDGQEHEVGGLVMTTGTRWAAA